jgi:hypothetical protein
MNPDGEFFTVVTAYRLHRRSHSHVFCLHIFGSTRQLINSGRTYGAGVQTAILSSKANSMIWRILFPQILLFWATTGHCARLVDFQVAQPPPLPLEAKQCTVPILQ